MKVFAEVYHGVHPILDYFDLEQNLNCLEPDTLFNYMQGKIKLKRLSNKIYRIFNRLNNYISIQYDDDYNQFMKDIKAYMIIKKKSSNSMTI